MPRHIHRGYWRGLSLILFTMVIPTTCSVEISFRHHAFFFVNLYRGADSITSKIMKRLFAFLLTVMAFVACEDLAPDAPPVPPTITIETPEPSAIPDEGGEAVVEFVAPEPWVIEIDATRAEDWVTVEPMSGEAGNAKITITTKPNDTYEDRSATISIKAGTLEKTISITQKQNNSLEANGNVFEVDYLGGTIDFDISTNVDMTVTISDDAKDWISEVSTRALETKSLSFEIAPHMSTASRTGEITIAGGGLEQTIVVKQVYPVPNDEIWYTSTDGEIVIPGNDNVFGATIVSNEYKDGKGVIKFSGDVTTIGQHAFPGGGRNLNMKTILLPNSVKEIGPYAFGSAGTANGIVYNLIEEIIIPESVTKIDGNPFSTTNITTFYGKYASEDHKALINDGVLISYALGKATELVIPEGVKEIGKQAICAMGGSLSHLTKVTFPSSLTIIGESAFSGAVGLTSLDIPSSITTIGKYAFNSCRGLTELTIPSNVTTIGERAFAACENVETLTIAEGVKHIGKYAFERMGITEVTIPNSVETFDGNPFVLNYQLQSFKGKYATADNEALIKDGVFVSIVGNRWFEEYNIPDGVTEIGGGAFKDNRAFGKINIPASVTKIGDEAFTGQFNVVFTWSDNITEIGYQGFAYCFMYGTIENLVLPASLKTIGERAFLQMGAKTLTIPTGVTSIGKYAFQGAAALETVTCLATTPPEFDKTAFSNITTLAAIKVPASAVNAYKQAAGWSDYADLISADLSALTGNTITYTSTDGNVVTPYSTTVFGANIVSNVYENGQGVITFDNTVATIGNEAFKNCTTLATITIPECVVTIGTSAFEGSGLTGVSIPSGVTKIGDRAFNNCSNVTTLSIGSTVRTIGAMAFAGTQFTEVTLPNSLTTLGYGAFYNNSKLAQFSGKFATADGNALIDGEKFLAFAHGGAAIDEYTIPSSVTEVCDYAFAATHNDIRVGTVNIPDSVEKIGNRAFLGLQWTDIVWGPNSRISEIGTYAFAWSFTLESNAPNGPFVTLPANLEVIPDYAFYYSYIQELTIPAGVKSIGVKAFNPGMILSRIVCEATTPPALSADSFFQWDCVATIYVPAASVNAYKQAAVWSTYADKIVAIE